MADANSTLGNLDIARFWSHVEVSNQFQCWAWRGVKTAKGYGRFSINKKWVPAHRVAYELSVGAIPHDQIIRHRCDNPSCCNPRHLLPGTKAQNSADAVERSRLATGARNGRSRISEADARYIRANPDRLTLAKLAEQFKMAQSSIHYIRCGRSWKMVGDDGLEPSTYAV